jgi:uncharacterized membrane protein
MSERGGAAAAARWNLPQNQGMRISRSHRLTGILVILPILLLALGLRVHEMRSQNLWFDEAIEFNIAARPLAEVVAADQAGTHDPPLFSVALNVWMLAGRTDFQARLLPVFASVLATAATFVLGRATFSAQAGWFSALLVAVAPRSVFYGLELNQYGFVLLLTVLSTLLVERYLKRPTTLRLTAFVGAGGAAILTHYSLAVFLVPLVAVGTLSLVRRRGQTRSRRWLGQWCVAISVLALIGGVLLWSYALPQKARLPASFAAVRYSEPINLAQEMERWTVQTEELLRTVLWGFEPTPFAWFTLGLLLIGTGVCLIRTGRRLVLYLLGGLLLAYWLAGVGFLVYWHRYQWYAFPLEVLVICGGLMTLAGGRYRRFLNPLAYLVLSGLALLLFVRLPAMSGSPFPETEQVNQVLDYLRPRYQEGDIIYVYYGARPAFVRYAAGDLARTAVIQGWSRGITREKQEAQLWEAINGRPRVWLLLAHTHASDAAILPEALNQRCRQIDQLAVTGAAGYLFDCAQP